MTFRPSVFSFKFLKLFLIRTSFLLVYICFFYVIAPHVVVKIIVALIGFFVWFVFVCLPLFEKMIFHGDELQYINYGIVFPRFVRGAEKVSWGNYRLKMSEMDKFIIEWYYPPMDRYFTLYGTDPGQGYFIRPSQKDVSLLSLKGAWTEHDMQKVVQYVKSNYPHLKEVTFDYKPFKG